MKLASAQTIIQAFEQFAPKNLAEDWDPIGLQVGTLNKKVKKIMITLDVMENVVEEAIAKEVDLIIAHHPIMFRPIKKLDTSRPNGALIEKLIKNDITVYAAHTNLDVTKGGVNDMLAELLGIESTEVLVPTSEIKYKKLVVFVPVDHAENVRQAVGNVGAGFIGNYSHCTFNIRGTGTFLPQEGTDPFIGENGKLEYVDEIRIETIFPETIEKTLLRAMIDAHPYEEVAYDVYPLENQGEMLGLGRVGRLKAPKKLQDFAKFIKDVLNLENISIVGDLNSSIQKVAILGGSGGDYIHAAKFSGADVLVTGDIKFHTAQDAMIEGLNLIDAGHYIEHVMKQGVSRVLEEWLKVNKYDTTIIQSEVNTNPFTYL